MPDAVFDDPRLASLYDVLDPDRSDLDTYLSTLDEELAIAAKHGCHSGGARGGREVGG